MEILHIVLNDIIVICTGSLFICVIMFWHITRVYDYRRDILNKIHAQCMADLGNNNDWEWRYRVFETVDFDDMVRKFWKPLDSFFPNKSFIEETE